MKTPSLLFLTVGIFAFTSSSLPGQEPPKAAASPSLPTGKLAFVMSESFGSAGNIYVMSGDHRSMTLAYQTHELEFLPDGNRIVYNANDARGNGLHIYDLTQHTNTLLFTAAGRVGEPSISPDGSRIAFVRYDGENSSQIMTADLDGKNVKQLTDGEYFNWTPRWSPDGSELLFETTRNETPATSGGGGQRDIYVMDADGKNQTNLTPNSYGHHPSWSPDGKHIAYMKYGAIFTMNRDGSAKKNVSQGKVRDSEPAWSPDGQWIAFTRTPKGSNAMDIWIMKSDGTQQTQLTFNQGSTASFGPSWSKE